MLAEHIVHAWKNEDYLLSLTPAEISALPENPAGTIDLRAYGKRQIFTVHCTSVVIECSASNCF